MSAHAPSAAPAPRSAADARSHLALAIYSMWLRELVRFWRQKGRLAGALGTPLVIWIVLGAGFGDALRPAGAAEGTRYLEFFFPGIVVLTVLFTAIYSTITVIEDRQEGFLQGVLVAPVSRAGVVVGKMLGGTTLAIVQGALVLFAGPLVGVRLGAASLAAALLVLVLVAFALTGLGMLIAWMMDSSGGFHAIMNLLLMPMWMLSGAVFPYEGAHPVLRAVMVINPLTYGVDGLRGALAPGDAHSSWMLSLTVTILFGLLTMAASIRLADRKAGRER